MLQDSLYDIYGMDYVPFWQTSFYRSLLYCMGAFLFLVLIGVGFYLYKKIRAKKKSVWDDVLAKFDVLRGAVVHEKPAHIYSEISHNIKKCIRARYHCDTFAKTDAELVAYLEEQKIPAELINELRNLIEHKTEIKFGCETISQERIAQDLACAINIVKKMVPCHTQKQSQ